MTYRPEDVCVDPAERGEVRLRMDRDGERVAFLLTPDAADALGLVLLNLAAAWRREREATAQP